MELKSSINTLVDTCHGAARSAGWWNDLMLIVTEVAEAKEGHRKSKMDDHLPHRTMVEVELADAVIRICDLAGALRLDLGGAIAEKLAYNARREDHKIENRRKVGGKAT